MYTAATIFPIVGQSTRLVWESRSTKHIISTESPPLHILPWQQKGHGVPDMFSCQPLVDFLNKKKRASSSLAEGRLSGTWHNEI